MIIMLNIPLKKHYWCKFCGVPIISKVCLNCGNESDIEIPTDFKPVFKKEYELYLESLKNNKITPLYLFPKVLYRSRNMLFSDISLGKPHYQIKVITNKSNEGEVHEFGDFSITLKDKYADRRSRTKKFFLEDPKYMKKLINANERYLAELEKEAIEFIKNTHKKYRDYFQICSFSGGKDSSVTAYLVKQAIGRVPIVYSDTGIEYPLSQKYVKEFGNYFGDLLYLEKQVDFKYMCEKLGPPSRTMRWCCFTNKGAPLSKFYAELKHRHVLSFDGIRALESNSRSLYSRERDNTKYEKQFSAYPILYWTTLEVWLYLFWRNIPYNPIYEYGFSRVGCWACPNNTQFDWFLFSKIYPQMTKDWFQFIYEYSQKQNKKMGKDDREYEIGWVEGGHWKKRRVKYHDINNLKDLKIDGKNRTYELELNFPIKKNLKEFLKVFGELIENTQNQNHIENQNQIENQIQIQIENENENDKKSVHIQNDNLNIDYIEGDNKIRFHFKNEKKEKELKHLIVRQINKSYNCINCGACVGSCPQGAIYIDLDKNENKRLLKINTNKCAHCLICTGTKYIDMSCIALHYKEDRIYIKMKSI